MEGIRYANIGMLVGIAIIIGGVLVFKDSSEAAMQAVAMIGFFTGLGVALTLGGRAKRRRRESAQ